jgi:hypothetical protein
MWRSRRPTSWHGPCMRPPPPRCARGKGGSAGKGGAEATDGSRCGVYIARGGAARRPTDGRPARPGLPCTPCTPSAATAAAPSYAVHTAHAAASGPARVERHTAGCTAAPPSSGGGAHERWAGRTDCGPAHRPTLAAGRRVLACLWRGGHVCAAARDLPGPGRGGQGGRGAARPPRVRTHPCRVCAPHCGCCCNGARPAFAHAGRRGRSCCCRAGRDLPSRLH